MNALEFNTKIEQGIIRLPVEYEEYQNAYVRIIMLVEKAPLPLPSQKEKMRLAFQKMKDIAMFSGIENPVEWQKKQRDGWE